MPLRLSVSLWNEIAQWAEDDFRSMNGQIEYLLTECVKYRKKHRKPEEYYPEGGRKICLLQQRKQYRERNMRLWDW